VRAQAHPLAVDWYYLQQQISESEAAKSLKLSERSLFFLDELVRVSALLTIPGIGRLLARIGQHDQFHSAMFESLVLSLYRQSGAEIEIVPELSEAGQRRPDFRVKTPGGDVYVECKSLEDFSRKEERIWEQLEAQIVRRLETARRYWRVMIEAKRELGGADIAALSSAVEQSAAAGLLDQIVTDDGLVSITFEVLASDDSWFGGDLAEFERRGELGWCESEQHVSPLGTKYYCHPIFVEGKPFKRADDTKRILADISDAHGQVAEEEVGVVHIQVPYKDGRRLLDIADNAFQRMFGLLRQKRRLACAVLSARTLDPQTKAGQNPIMDFHVVVPNPKPCRELPREFVTVGAVENPVTPPRSAPPHAIEDFLWALWLFLVRTPFRWARVNPRTSSLDALLRREEGSLFIEFGIYQPLKEQPGRCLFSYCSRDGRRQLKLWQSFAGKFRFDVVHAAFGRRTFSVELGDLELNTMHKLAVSWSRDALTAVLDGRFVFQPVPQD